MKKVFILLMMNISLSSFASFSNFSIKLEGDNNFSMFGTFISTSKLLPTKGNVSGIINNKLCQHGNYHLNTGLFKKKSTMEATFQKGSCPHQKMEFTFKTKDIDQLFNGKDVEVTYRVDNSSPMNGVINVVR